MISLEPVTVFDVSEYPETMRGGSWDRQAYTGSPDAALARVREISAVLDKFGQRPILRSHGQSPAWTASRPQWWYDGWRRAWRLLRFYGLCVVCGCRTYHFDDGENDPRGVLGDRAAQAVTHENVPELRDGEYVAACFACMNEEPSYRYALERARNAARRLERARNAARRREAVQ